MNYIKRSWQENLVFAADIIVIIGSYVAAFFIRFDGIPPHQYLNVMLRSLPAVAVFRTAALLYFRLHKSIWRYASIKDLLQIIKAITVSSVIIAAFSMLIHSIYPRSIFVIDWLLLLVGLSGMRFIIRLSRPFRERRAFRNGLKTRVLVVGAGNTGETIVREMLYGYSQRYEVAGIVDDDPKKLNKTIHGIPVVGDSRDIPSLVRSMAISEVVIAIPTLTVHQTRDIVSQCIKSGAKYRIVPDIADVIDGTVQVKDLREVRLEDLLRREEVRLNYQEIRHYIEGKTVLITGAGGSIGSELCRQTARCNPRSIILLDNSENALFYIDTELKQTFAGLEKTGCVADLCDRKRIVRIMNLYRPQIIFHAAAYKHVPLMELNPFEAIRNNVLGTYILGEAALMSGALTLVMLSTDKAVDPSSVMGVSKNIAEQYITIMGIKHARKFMAVRFGNVLGSEGSVIQVFRKQIEKKHPLTVTHPDIERFFMTIPEAAGLVVQTCAIGRGGEVFVLEMGKQIKIADLATDMITLCGLEPYRDIDIVFTGLRPGEKMCETLVGINEYLEQTTHPKISRLVRDVPRSNTVIKVIRALERVAGEEDINTLIEILRRAVPTYTPSEELLKIALAQNGDGLRAKQSFPEKKSFVNEPVQPMSE